MCPALKSFSQIITVTLNLKSFYLKDSQVRFYSVLYIQFYTVFVMILVKSVEP